MITETVIERAATSILAKVPVGYGMTKEEAIEYARTALQALREPTADMIVAAGSAEHEHFWPGKSPTSHTWTSLPKMLILKIWRAMIDAALQEKAQHVAPTDSANTTP